MERKPIQRKTAMKRVGRKRVKTALEGPKVRKKPSVLRSLRTKLWELSKAITRARYGNICYTCGKGPLVGSGWHTGHFIPRSICGFYLRYDLRNLRPQCYGCNIDRGGNGAIFYRNLVRDEGQAYVDQLFAEKELITKETKDFYFAKIAEYTLILGKLGDKPETDTLPVE